jgi:hypothetical protein
MKTALRIVAEIAQSVTLPAAIDAIGDTMAMRSSRRIATWAIAQILTAGLTLAITTHTDAADTLPVARTEQRA